MIIKKMLKEIFLNLRLDKKQIYLIYLLPISLLAGSLIININVLLICILYLFELYKEKKFRNIFNKDFFILLALFSYLLFSSIFVSKSSYSFTSALGFIRFIILAFALSYYFNLENNKYEKKIINFWTIIFIVVTFDIFFEFFFGNNIFGFQSNYPGRIASFTNDELKIGGFYFGLVLIVLARFYSLNFYFYVLAFVFLLASLLIGEKSNFLKIFFIIFCFLFIAKKEKIMKKVVILIITIILLTLLFFFNNSFYSRFTSPIIKPLIGNNFESLTYKNRHFFHYHIATKIFNENKLIGVGYKKFRNESYKKKYFIKKDSKKYYGGSTHPHQIHFEFLSELGIIGYLLFVAFIIYYIINGFIIYKKNNNLYLLAATLFMLATVLPILPSGSFFTTYTGTIFWTNLSIILKNKIFQ